MHPLQGHWDTLDKLLRQSLGDVRSQLPANEANAVGDYIGHNEFGLAFELLLELLQEHAVALHATTREKLDEAAVLMAL
ncbi:MafI family immunity protein [Sphingomonas sp.]|uniref:MafI family immunity protein n=1 Tax=Sphingomonas sp. TaxID=28214 RepID=UPI002DB859BC|nr:MafI family immunity protein [Sphingomonas sp.]HEU4968565.1 MafI family immunity protein [Sphingomonas sp.]